MVYQTNRFRLGRAAAVFVLASAAVVVSAKVKIDVMHDPEFDFRPVRTFAWHPGGAGEVKVLVKNSGDPQKLRERFEPVIKPAVEQELTKKGLTLSLGGTPDVYASYYVLITAGDSSQAIGQFLSPTMEWGVPPFAGATQSLKIYEQGSLILDLSSPSLKSAVWRGVAKAEIERQRSEPQRDARIREAVREMIKKYPPKSKK
jgi:Domain of unknown function (DUF4136)